MRIDDNSIKVDRHKCVACGICVDRCIMDNLRLSIAPCRQVCPVNMNCQGYIRLIAMGKEEQAVSELSVFGPFVPIIANTCHAPCETICTRKKKDGAVHILALKRYLTKTYQKAFQNIQLTKEASDKTVATVGLAISSLAAIFKLIQNGHKVTLYATDADSDLASPAVKNVLELLGKTGALTIHTNLADDGLTLADLERFDASIIAKHDDCFCNDEGMPKNNNLIVFDPLTHQVKGNIFCSDIESGKKRTPVYEIAAGFETAQSVNRYLEDEPINWGRGFYTQDGAMKAYRADERVGSGEEPLPQSALEKVLDGETAQKQASRCYGCGRAFEKNQTCWYCLPCELECPQEALEVRIPYLVR